MNALLLLLAVLLVVSGIVQLVLGERPLGVVSILIGSAFLPSGYAMMRPRG